MLHSAGVAGWTRRDGIISSVPPTLQAVTYLFGIIHDLFHLYPIGYFALISWFFDIVDLEELNPLLLHNFLHPTVIIRLMNRFYKIQTSRK